MSASWYSVIVGQDITGDSMSLWIKHLHMWWAICRGPVWAISIGTMLFSGCATQSATQVQQPFNPSWTKKIHIEPCIDRTGFSGRDLAEEATRTLTDKLKNAGLFEIAADAGIILTCDIERFAEGSAFKRWLVPGWGATQAGISVMLWEKPGDKVLAVFRSQSAVSAGGLYTIGADQYILGTAIDGIIEQLNTWVSGASHGSGN